MTLALETLEACAGRPDNVVGCRSNRCRGRGRPLAAHPALEWVIIGATVQTVCVTSNLTRAARRPVAGRADAQGGKCGKGNIKKTFEPYDGHGRPEPPAQTSGPADPRAPLAMTPCPVRPGRRPPPAPPRPRAGH